ncbi:MAG: TlpA disulfide reductase family protein [Candidatus Cloacimonadaceae bacterium]
MKIFILAWLLLLSAVFLGAETMPDFTLPDLNNKDVTLSELLNKGPILIDFWATWCAPCKKAMPALNKLAEKYDSLTVVVISIDAPKDVAKAKSYLKSNNYKFISLFDSEKKLATKLNIVNPPHTFILDKVGEIIYTHEGYESGAEAVYEERILSLLTPAEPDELEQLEEEPTELLPEEETDPIKDHTPCGNHK